MTDDHLLYEKIDQYLKGNLQEGEMLAFENQLSNDASMQSLVATQKIANQIIHTKQLIALQTKIQSDLSSKKRWNHYRNLLGISAVLLSVGGSVYFASKTEKPIATTSTSSIEAVTNITKETNSISSAPSITNKTQEKKSIATPASTIQSLQVVQNNIDGETEKKEEISTQPILPVENKTETALPIPVIEKKVDCSKLTAEFAFASSPACLEEQDGKITINKLKINGGSAPYDFALNRKTSFLNVQEFRYLNPGTYTIYVRDANQCIAQTEIEVKEKTCKQPNNFAFTPEFEKWKIPVQQNKQGNIKIFNKSGNLVYSSDVSFDKENLWEGTSANGMILGSGYYTYRIIYSDGEEELGTVSILQP